MYPYIRRSSVVIFFPLLQSYNALDKSWCRCVYPGAWISVTPGTCCTGTWSRRTCSSTRTGSSSSPTLGWLAHSAYLSGQRVRTGPEMEVTEIIFPKVSILRQLSSHNRGFLSYQMKRWWNRYKIIKNPYPYQPLDFKNVKNKIRKPKVSRLLPAVCDFQ